MKFEIYPEQSHHLGVTTAVRTGLWRWRLKARNGKIIADSGEAYNTEQGVRRAITKLNSDIVYAGMFLPVMKVKK